MQNLHLNRVVSNTLHLLSFTQSLLVDHPKTVSTPYAKLKFAHENYYMQIRTLMSDVDVFWEIVMSSTFFLVYLVSTTTYTETEWMNNWMNEWTIIIWFIISLLIAKTHFGDRYVHSPRFNGFYSGPPHIFPENWMEIGLGNFYLNLLTNRQRKHTNQLKHDTALPFKGWSNGWMNEWMNIMQM